MPDIRAVTVGQWLGIMRKDGPGSETETNISSPGDFIRFRNEQRAKKGLPPLPMLSGRDGETKIEGGGSMALDKDLKAGIRVITPHGAGEVVSQVKDDGGWMVKLTALPDPIFYHAGDLTIMPTKPAAQPTPKTEG